MYTYCRCLIRSLWSSSVVLQPNSASGVQISRSIFSFLLCPALSSQRPEWVEDQDVDAKKRSCTCNLSSFVFAFVLVSPTWRLPLMLLETWNPSKKPPLWTQRPRRFPFWENGSTLQQVRRLFSHDLVHGVFSDVQKVSASFQEVLQEFKDTGEPEQLKQWRQGGHAARKVKMLQQRVRSILEDWLEYYRRATGTSHLLFCLFYLPKCHVFQSKSLLGAVQSRWDRQSGHWVFGQISFQDPFLLTWFGQTALRRVNAETTGFGDRHIFSRFFSVPRFSQSYMHCQLWDPI